MPGVLFCCKVVACPCLNLPNWCTNVVRYDDLSSNFRLWYREVASMIDIYLTLLSLGSISFSEGPLCTGLINVWFSHAGSKHNQTLPLALGTNTKLLHHSNISLTPSCIIVSFCFYYNILLF